MRVMGSVADTYQFVLPNCLMIGLWHLLAAEVRLDASPAKT